MRRKKIEFFCEVNGNKNELHKYRKKKYNNTQKYMVSREGGINVLLFNSEWYYNDAQCIIRKDGFDIVKVHFERPNDDGFDFLDMTLPGEIVYKSFGFSEDEILKLKRYAKNNSSLIWDFDSERRRRKCLKRCLIS